MFIFYSNGLKFSSVFRPFNKQYQYSKYCQLAVFSIVYLPYSFPSVCCPLYSFYSLLKVWPVTVKARGLACTMSLTGESQLCLTAVSLILVRGNGFLDLPLATIPLLTVRCFGHLNFSFFVELGRSAPDGPGEIWMEARDQGNKEEILFSDLMLSCQTSLVVLN